MVCLFQNFAKLVTRGIHLIWFMLVIVGAGSCYFHATLTMVLHLFDYKYIYLKIYY